MNNHMKSKIYLLSLLAFIMFLQGCSDSDKHASKKQLPLQVATTQVRFSAMQSTNIATGVLAAIRKVNVFNETEGRILEIPVFAGDKVSKGQTIIKLDDSIIQAELARANAVLAQAELDFKRQSRLKKKGLISDDILTRAKTAVDVASANTRVYASRLAHTTITAPFDGYIAARLKEPGDVVATHTHIITIVDKSALKAELPISEYLLETIKVGDPLKLSIDAVSNQVFDVKVSRIFPTIDTSTHQGIIEVELNPAPTNALPGQFCRVEITAGTQPRLNIPLGAVKHDYKGEFVFKITKTEKGNIVKRTPIRAGIQIGERIEVRDGLSEADIIVSRGFIGLRDNKVVSIVTAVANEPDRNIQPQSTNEPVKN